MKLKDVKEMQNIFKSNLNEISRGRFKSKDQKSALKILNCFINQDKLLLNYSMIILHFMII